MLKLVDYCDSWKDAFQNEKKILLLALRGQKVLEVEHIGATSVVLCKTCGTIDILCSIVSKYDLETIKNILTTRDYQFLKSQSTDDCYVFARRNQKNQIVALVRIVEQASKEYKEIILFKHYLREKEKHVLTYNQFRKALLEQCGGDAKQYQQIKKNYIESILHDFCEVR